MLFRIRLDLVFVSQAEANQVYQLAETVFEKAVKIIPADNPIGEPSFIEMHKCYHDEALSKPCEVIKRKEK